MKHYFISNKKMQEGPYTLADLTNKNITKDTLIWFPGSKGWQQASTITELTELISFTGDKLIPKSKAALENIWDDDDEIETQTSWMLKIITIVIVLLIIFHAFSKMV